MEKAWVTVGGKWVNEVDTGPEGVTTPSGEGRLLCELNRGCRSSSSWSEDDIPGLETWVLLDHLLVLPLLASLS